MRTPQPWFRASKNTWFVEIDGRQCSLGKHPEGADPPKKGKTGWNPPPEIVTAYRKLMAEGPGDRLPDPANLRVATVCDLFLQHSEKHHELETFAWYRGYLQDFSELYGTLLAIDLKPFHVSRWLDAHPGWTGSRRNAVIAVKRAFNWAEGEGVLPSNPLRKVKKPPQTYRTRTLSKEEKQEILAAIKDQSFRDFVFAMQETGCRPSEIRKVTAKHVDLALGVWVFAEHKTAKKTGRPRVVYLTPAMVDLTKELVSKWPEGPLFRGPRSKRGMTRNGVRCRFRNLRIKLPHLAGVISYTYRHSFATDALVNGVGIAQVAELLGHTGTDMVSRHYQHIAGKVDHMREAARRAAGGSDQSS